MLRRLGYNLTVQVLIAVADGALLGALAPTAGRAMRPVGDTFINLVMMVITPVICLAIVLGIAGSNDLTRVDDVGVRALLYFEVVSTFALAIGLIIGNAVATVVMARSENAVRPTLTEEAA
ncbi:MAG: cation:dicarboxylate symporter family transporter [Gemmatimonadales bacterium]